MKYTHKGGRALHAEPNFFVSKALSDAYYLGDLTDLEVAIELGLPELLDNTWPEGTGVVCLSSRHRREMLKAVLRGERGYTLGRGQKAPYIKRDLKKRDTALWHNWCYWVGRGMASDGGKEDDACDAVARSFQGVGRDAVRKIKDAHGGVEGIGKDFGAGYWHRRGQSDRTKE